MHLHEPGFAASGERPTLETADTGSACAERNRLQHVRAAINTAVDDDLGASPDRLDDLGKHFKRPRCAVELPAAVVGHVDRVASGFDGKGRILAVAMPFRITGSQERIRMRSIVRHVSRAVSIRAWAASNVLARPLAQHFLRRRIGARLAAPRAEPVDEVALTPGVVGRLRYNRDGVASGRHRLVDGTVEPGLVAANV